LLSNNINGEQQKFKSYLQKKYAAVAAIYDVNVQKTQHNNNRNRQNMAKLRV